MSPLAEHTDPGQAERSHLVPFECYQDQRVAERSLSRRRLWVQLLPSTTTATSAVMTMEKGFALDSSSSLSLTDSGFLNKF